MKEISIRIQFTYVLLLVIVILSTVVVSYVGGSRQLEKEVIQSNLNMLGQINKRIESMLGEIDRATIQVLQTKEANYYYSNSRSLESDYLLQLFYAQRLLSGVRSAHPLIESIYMYSRRNEMVLSDKLHEPIERMPSVQWATAYMDDPSYYKWTAYGSQQARKMVTLIRYYPFVEQPLNRSGAIVVNISASSLSDMFEDLRFSGDGNVFIINSNGVILSHKDETKIGSSIVDYKYSNEILTSKGSGSINQSNGKLSEWVFFDASEYTDWKIVYVVSQKQVNGVFITIRNLLIGLAALMIVMSVVSVVIMNRRWINPIERFIIRIDQMLDRQPNVSEHHKLRTLADLGPLEDRVRHMIVSYADTERQVHASKPALKMQILFDIFMGYRSQYEQTKAYFDHIGIPVYPENFVVMVVEYDNRATRSEIRDFNLYLYAVCNIAEDLMKTGEHGLCGAAVQINELQTAVLISFSEPTPDSNEQAAIAFARSLQDVVVKYFKQPLSIGIGSHYRYFNEIKSSYQEALKLVQYKLVSGRNSIITRHQITEDTSGLMYLYQSVEDLLEAVRQVNSDKALLALGEMFDIASDSNFTHSSMVQFALQLVYRVGRAAGDSSLIEQVQGDHDLLSNGLQQCETVTEMKELIESFVSTVIDRTLEKRMARKRTSDVVEKIILYINDHYANPDISLNYLAEKFDISPSYLSKSFKEYLSMNFVDYIIQVRVNAAQALLSESNMSINQIAEKVGYSNVTSFMRTFKKINGLTPSEYRMTYQQ